MATQGTTSSVGRVLAGIALCSLAFAPAAQAFAAAPAEKNETVHVYTAADGSVTSSEVTATLTNPGGADELDDSSVLSNIRAEDDGATYTGNGVGIVWRADGENVTYTGDSSQRAPVSVSVTYRFNGSVITPSELAGKSGHVSIRYDYSNDSLQAVTMGGATYEVYTPFTAITAMLLDSDSFKNVKVTNGRVIDDSGRIIVVGYAMPGLAASLDISPDDADIPDYFEVEADVTDFELKSTLTMVTPNMLDGFDTGGIDTAGLSDTSVALNEAVVALAEGGTQLSEGVAQLADAAAQVAEGAEALDAGMSGISAGLAQMSASSGQLVAGAQGIDEGLNAVDSVLDSAAEDLKAILFANDAANMQDKVQEALQQAQAQLQQAAQALSAAQAQTGAVAAQAAQAQDGIAQAQAALQSVSTDDPEVAAALQSASAALDEAQEGTAGALQAAGEMGAQSLQESALGIDAAGIEVQAVSDSDLEKLYGVYAKLLIVDGQMGSADKAGTLLHASGALGKGAAQLSAYIAQVAAGAAELAEGSGQLAGGTAAVAEGASALGEGSQELVEGIRQFGDQGISQITDVIDNKLLKLVNRYDAVSEAGARYTNFGGIAEGTAGSVKFVYETAAIAKS